MVQSLRLRPADHLAHLQYEGGKELNRRSKQRTPNGGEALTARITLTRWIIPFIAAAVLTTCAPSHQDGQQTVTPPPTVQVASEPNATERLSDPQFEPLPGAVARFGRLGGSVYQIEMPLNWNKRLVLYLHGQNGKFEPVLNVEMPTNRSELIRQGYAWAASSFSRGDFPFGTGADETAAVWDRFVGEFGRPSRTFAIGSSAGGASALIAASRYASRIDGILALCPGPGTRPDIQYLGDTVVAALYAVGVNQLDFRPMEARATMADLVLPALRDEVNHRRFVDTWIQLTGGPRPFAEEGLRLEENYLLTFGAKLIQFGSVDNTQEVYRASMGGTELTDFNDRAVRVASPNLNRAAEESDNVNGAIQMPVLALYGSGDAIVPPSAASYIRQVVDAASKHDLLVQRVDDSPKHCGFEKTDVNRAFDDLVAWVEHSDRPAS